MRIELCEFFVLVGFTELCQRAKIVFQNQSIELGVINPNEVRRLCVLNSASSFAVRVHRTAPASEDRMRE